MNTPEDPDLKPGEPSPPRKPAPYMSPRLREKFGEGGGMDDDFQIKEQSPVGMVVGIVIVLALLVGGVMYMQKASAARKAKQAVEDARLAAAARADSIRQARSADSMRVAQAHADSIAAANAPKPKPGAKPAGGATAAAAPGAAAGATPAPAVPAAPPAHFGIDAGTFLSEDRANQEKDKLTAATKLSGRVVNTETGDFRVVLGDFSSKKEAMKKAAELAAGGQTREALVVAIKE